jgi:abortive infection bacteriophage resistance protein
MAAISVANYEYFGLIFAFTHAVWNKPGYRIWIVCKFCKFQVFSRYFSGFLSKEKSIESVLPIKSGQAWISVNHCS